MKSSKANRSIIGWIIDQLVRILVHKLFAYLHSNIIVKARVTGQSIPTVICVFIIEHSFYLLFFLVPLIMTPFNYELFEFNKMLLVYLFTTIITAAWLIKMVLQKRIIFQRSFWDIPLIIFFISQFLSFLFSINHHTSFFGYYSRFHGGLLSSICYLMLYFAHTSNMKRNQTLSAIRYLLISGLLVSLYGIAEHFGVDANYWVQDVRLRVFSTLGQPNWLAAWLAAIIPLTWAFILNHESRSKNQRSLFIIPFRKNPTLWAYSLFILFYLCLLFTKSRSGLIAFGISFVLFWGLTNIKSYRSIFHLFKGKAQKIKLKSTQKSFIIIGLIVLFTTIIAGSPWTPSIKEFLFKKQQTVQPTSDVGGGTESGEIRKIVWKGAIDVWKNWPVFGSGVETFAYSYYNFRPREHNDVSEWDFLYNKAHNEYLNFLATTGAAGLGSYLLLIISFILWSIFKLFNFQFDNLQSIFNFTVFKKNQFKNSKIENSLEIKNLTIALFVGFISILVTNFFGFSVVAVGLLFFLIPAIAFFINFEPISKVQGLKTKDQRPVSLWQIFLISFIILYSLFMILRITQYWFADSRFAKGDKLNDAQQYQEALSYLQTAVKIRPKEPFYRNALSLTEANLALAAFTQKEATLASQLAKNAQTESDQTIAQNPVHLNFWKTRVRVFYLLTEIDSSYFQQVFDSLGIALQLAPTDAKIYYNLGLVYAQLDQKDLAIQTLEKTIELRPNYGEARFALATFYTEKGQSEKAKQQLQYILEKINPNDESAKQELEKL